MKKKILITSALPYANGPLHFGHIAGAYLPGDCYARFERLMHNDVIYICGSDEFGVAITLSAEMARRTPQEHVDIYHGVIKDLFQRMNFSFDHYSRTTWSGHIATTQQFFTDLLNNGYIEERVTDQLYSETDGRFLADRYVVGTCPKCSFDSARGDECPSCGASYDATDLINPRSKLTNSALMHKPTKHWFLLLEKFKERLNAWLETKSWKPNVTNFIKNYIDDLRPRAITRDSNWGIPIPLPNTEGKVLYVWFDAPIGYICATKEWAEKIGHEDRWKDYWLDENTKLVNFIGKDNIPFHAAIFPAMEMGQNIPYKIVDELPANEFFKLEGRQFSKSDGWYIDLDDFFSRYSTDQIRYTIAANAPETSDSEFTWKDFQIRCNSELLGKYGNLVNRVLVFAKNQCEGKVPAKGSLEQVDIEFLEAIALIVKEAKENYANFRVRRASQLIMELAQAGNVYFDSKHPWKDAKDPATHGRMLTTIACCLDCIKLLALLSSPIIPDAASKVWLMLGYGVDEMVTKGWTNIAADFIPQGQKLNEPKILFQRIEDAQMEQEILKLHALSAEHQKPAEQEAKPVEYAPLKAPIEYEDFGKIDLRVGVIETAVAVPKSKKLLQLQVDLGFEKRTIVSGISQFYQPEQLIGKKVVVVANLKPAVLMGVESRGMLLAGSLDKALEVVSIQQLPAGAIVT
ncbi:MAG: methionine--tRNA ligase [Parachlamydiaceae bacterium]|nr:methionine--tRNA ligase [Parachlamydiaceae bacterium]